MQDQSATITLIGRSSAWGLRVSAAQPRQSAHRQATPHDPSRVVMAWLHHRSYGTLGVYLRDAPGDRFVLPPTRQWLQVRGNIQPWHVYAQPDDPRSATSPELAPLAIALIASEIAVVHIADVAQWDVPLVTRPQHVRLLTGHRCGRGYLAPVAQQPDLSYWKTAGTPLAIATWNRIVGIVSSLGATRYLRYVLSAQPGRSERK